MSTPTDDKTKVAIERVSLGLQTSSLLVHVFCCGLPLIVNVAALGGLAGITLLPLGFEAWFHQNEYMIFGLAVVMVAVSGGLQLLSHRHAHSTHHEHHDCDEHGHGHAVVEVPACDHEDDCEKRSSTGRWLLLASVCLLALNAYMTFGFDHGH